MDKIDLQKSIRMAIPSVYNESYSYLEVLEKTIEAIKTMHPVVFEMEKNIVEMVAEALDKAYSDGTIDNIVSGNLSTIKKEIADLDTKTSNNILTVDNKASTTQRELDTFKNETTIKLAEKVDTSTHKKDIDGKRDKDKLIVMSELSQEVKSALTGGSVAIVGDNTIIESNIVDGQVTPKKLSVDIVKGYTNKYNLINSEKATDGFYVSYTTGELWANSNYKASDFIPVEPDTVYNRNTVEQMAVYDVNKTFIFGVSTGEKFTTTPNARYMRQSIKKGTTPIVTKDVDFWGRETDGTPKIKPSTIMGMLKSYGSGLIPETSLKLGLNGRTIYVPKDYTIFTTATKGYTRFPEGTYTVGHGQALVLRDYNTLEVIDYHNTYPTVKDDVTPLFIEYNGQLLSGVFDNRHFTTTGSTEAMGSGLHVGATRDYKTITDAVNYAKTVGGKITIHVDAGVYLESLNLTSNDNISIVGYDKLNTIIEDRTGDYHNAPLTMSGSGYFANLTFYSNHKEDNGYSLPSYAMHYENSGQGVCEFNNCDFISEQNSAVGIGMRANETLKFKNCHFKQVNKRPYNGGAFYCHSAQANATNQHIVIENCSVISDVGYALKIDDSNSMPGGEHGNKAGDMTISIINSVFYSNEHGHTQASVALVGGVPLDGNCLVGCIKLRGESFGNNIGVLND